MLAIDHILQQLHDLPTAQVIVASRHPIDAIRAYTQDHQRQLTEVSPDNYATAKLPHQAFAIVLDYLEHLDKTTGYRQLGQWRNLHCDHMWIGVGADNPNWHFDDFIALGCKRLGRFENASANQGGGLETGHTIEAYGYDLGRYNQRRDWNNPRYWANPDMWKKRW